MTDIKITTNHEASPPVSGSATPETDAATFHRDNGVKRDHLLVVTADFARELERERDESRDIYANFVRYATEEIDSLELERDELIAGMQIIARDGSGLGRTIASQFLPQNA